MQAQADLIPATKDHDKVFVCKYTGTPGVDEVLQGGGNPISIDYQPGREPGQYFNDAQGRSYVLEYDTGQPEPPVSDCPATNNTTTTTTTTTTSTTTTSTTVPETTSTSTTSTVPETTSTSTTTPPPPPPGATTTTTAPPTIRFTLLGPVCIGDFPFIDYAITATGTPNATATITLTPASGAPIVYTNQPLVGRIIWPGASVNPPDWPGWRLVNGVWVEDPTDQVLRQPLTVTAEVNPTTVGTVAYPPATAQCASPENPPPGVTTTTPRPPSPVVTIPATL